MPTISDIRVSSHCNELGGNLWNPAIRWTRKYAVFIEVETSDGALGLGECWCFDKAPDALIAFIKTEVAPSLLGRDTGEVDAISEALFSHATLSARHGILASAISGVDIAVWDLKAKAMGQPVHRCINPSGAGDVTTYASGGLYGDGKTIAKLAEEMRNLVTAGHRMVKMKVGGMSLDHDLERVQAVNDALPTKVGLILDAVYTYDVATALRMAGSLPDGRLVAFQSPVAAHDIEGMAHLVGQGVPVMATEAEYRTEIHDLMIARNAVTILQVAPIACGGISRVLGLADAIRDTPISLSLEVSSTAVALMAACQIAAAEPKVAHVEYHTVHDVFFDRLTLVQSARTGRRILPETTGIGISLPADAIPARLVRHSMSGATQDLDKRPLNLINMEKSQ